MSAVCSTPSVAQYCVTLGVEHKQCAGMRNIQFVNDEYYHIYNRGYGKQDIFLSDRDRSRFLFNLLCFQSPVVFSNLDRHPFNVQHPVLNKEGLGLEKAELDEIVKHRFVELNVFAFMPNHFHSIVRQVGDGGISRYMQRALNSYTKFFNKKYERSGHLFQGPYQVVPVESNEQLLYLSAYIHRNVREIGGWEDKEHEYPWSSYQDYVGKDRWGELLKRDVILDQFRNPDEYQGLVKKSGAKEKEILEGLFNIKS